MNKEKFLEHAQLYLLDELEEGERVELENSMMGNDELRREFESIRKLFETIAENRPADANEKLLVSARYDLMRKIREEASKTPVKEKIIEWLKNIFVTNYKISFGAITLVLIGVFVGYFMFYSSNDQPIITTSKSINIDDYQRLEPQITNIRIPNPFFEGGEIEVTFGGSGGISPISYKGTADDPLIQKVLATTLVEQTNPGLRLRTVNTISSQFESESFIPDPKVKEALITALKKDSNPAVRKEALNALTKFPFDLQIRDALLFVLSNDNNSGLRVAAINSLAQMKIQGRSLDDKIVSVLNTKAENDENAFIRLRAASLVKEVN